MKQAKLTPQQESFATGLASGLTQAEAYRRAYPKSRAWKDETVWRKASLLAAHGEVRARVRDLLERASSANEITVERVLKEMARLAFFDIRKLVGKDGKPISVQDLDDDTAAAIAGLEVAQVGNAMIGVGEVLKFKLADKNAALEKLAKHLGMYERDNKQQGSSFAALLAGLTGNVIGPVREDDTPTLSPGDDDDD